MIIASKQSFLTEGTKIFDYMQTSDQCLNNYFPIDCTLNTSNWKIIMKIAIKQGKVNNGHMGFLSDNNLNSEGSFRVFDTTSEPTFYSDLGGGTDGYGRRYFTLNSSLLGLDKPFIISRTNNVFQYTNYNGNTVNATYVSAGSRSDLYKNKFFIFANDNSTDSIRRIYFIEMYDGDMLKHNYKPVNAKGRPCWLDTVNNKYYFPYLKNNDEIFELGND